MAIDAGIVLEDSPSFRHIRIFNGGLLLIGNPLLKICRGLRIDAYQHPRMLQPQNWAHWPR